MGSVYYNENDPYCCAWLRNLIAAGHLPAGDVDDRSIEDVTPNDVRGYAQCHFFAGIGGWPYALRLAGWPDSRQVWTGSCPCQPFSQAGKGLGVADKRHLWPAWFHLIGQCQPATILGEQVSAAIRHGWVDLVRADLEAQGYAFGFAILGAHSVGAPHIRQRCYFVAESMRESSERRTGIVLGTQAPQRRAGFANGYLANRFADGGEAGELADTRQQQSRWGLRGPAEIHPAPFARPSSESVRCNNLGDAIEPGLEGHAGDGDDQDEPGRLGADQTGPVAAPSGAWYPCDWLPCIDGKSRPVEPGTFPLAHGIPGRVGRLRAYGNAIVPQLAAQFIRAYIEAA
jgi:DNA (cytosine-5)-methyltransferase 1